MTKRYEALTLDGSTVYKADSFREISEWVIQHREKNLRPHVAYIYDWRAESYYRYTTASINRNFPGNTWEFSQHMSFGGMVEALQSDIASGRYY